MARTRSTKTADGKVHSVDVPRSEWFALVKNAHVGYITWEDYQRNEAQLAVNSQAYARRPPFSATGRTSARGLDSSSVANVENG
jgi:hypothetical protein